MLAEEKSVDEIVQLITKVHALRDRRGNKGNKKKIIYKDCICSFDIETTRIPEIEQSVMYIWQFGLLVNDTIYYTYGRTWKEFNTFVDMIHDSHLRLVIYVHNLSYEFQFLRNVFSFSNEDVFAVKSRKILKCVSEEYNIEFRCSYLLTNLGLDAFTKKMSVEHQKLSGEEFDYSKKRYPWTKMSSYEMQYSFNDVIGLLEAIHEQMVQWNDNLYTIPLTSTGYIRRMAKNALKSFNFKQRSSIIKSITPDLYTELREGFRGGDTHANRYYVNETLYNVKSCDRSSSYPDVIVNDRFPMSPFQKENDCDENDLIRFHQFGKCYIARFSFTRLKQKDIFYGSPYISKDKSRMLENEIVDNGRILSADFLETTLTDVDFDIVKQEYTWDSIEIHDVFTSKYDYLPKELINLVIKLYTDKTELKGVEDKVNLYNASKALINSVYGMMAQDPVKFDIIFDETNEKTFYIEDRTEEKKREKLEKYYKKNFLSYAWGVWVTAWARYRLKEMVNIVGHSFVYCDTDSVKYLESEDKKENERIERLIKKYNKVRQENSRKNGGFATDKHGITHFMGVYEDEGIYKEFKTLGAKKYVYKYNDDILHCTIAGVNKKYGGEELKSCDNFKVGFTFNKAGGTESVYNDRDYGLYDIVDNGKKHSIYIGKNIVIRPSSYKIGITAEYERVLESAELLKEFERKCDND